MISCCLPVLIFIQIKASIPKIDYTGTTCKQYIFILLYEGCCLYLYNKYLIYTILGTEILPNSLLHLKRWSAHLQSFNESKAEKEIKLPDFSHHPSIGTLQEAFQVLKGNYLIM